MDYLRVGLVIAPQLFAGCLIYLLLLKQANISAIELVSIGGVVGIISCTIVDQIFVNLKLPRIGWLVAVLVAISIFLFVKGSKNTAISIVFGKFEFTQSFAPVIAISAMALGTEWYWLFPSGVLFTVAAFLSIASPRRYSRSANRATNLAAIVLGISMITYWPRIWWFQYETDFPFIQAYARSIADRGLGDSVHFSGSPVKGYWFLYGWIGLVDRASDASTFFVLTRVAPILFVFLITGIVWSLIDHYSVSRLRTFSATLVVLTASSYPLWGGGMKTSFLASPTTFFTFAPLLALVLLLLRNSPQPLYQKITLIALLSAATMLSKFFHSVIIIAAIAFALIAQLFCKSKMGKTTVITCLTMLITSLATYFLFVSNSESNSILEIRFGDYIWQLQGDARLLSERAVDVIGFLTVISFLILPGLLIVANLLRTRFIGLEAIHLIPIGSIVVGTFLGSILLFAFGENLYFVLVAGVVATALGFASISSDANLPKIGRLTTAILVVVGIGLCLLSFWIPNANSGAITAIKVRSMRVYTPALILGVVALVVLIHNAIRRRPSFIQIWKLTIVASAMVVSFSVVNWIHDAPEKHSEYSRNGETYLATTEMTGLANWANSYTDDADIFASNFGWPTTKPGEFKYFSEPCLSTRIKEITTETCRRTNNSLLIAYLHRRFWLQSTSLNGIDNLALFNPTMNSRQTASVGFATDPTMTQKELMLADNVDWFIVDRSTTNRTSWEPFATIEYTNDSFFALRLNRPK